MMRGCLLFVCLLLLAGCIERVERVCETDDNCLTNEVTVCHNQRCLPKLCDLGDIQKCTEVTERGVCVGGLQYCTDHGSAWSECLAQVTKQTERCDGLDNDCDGSIDEGLECGCERGTRRACFSANERLLQSSTAPCSRGIQYCTQEQTWGRCLVQILPQQQLVAEVHNLNGTKATHDRLTACIDRDKDCDGLLDETPACLCEKGQTRSCYLGDPKQQGDGRPCKAGTQRCVQDPEKNRWVWGFCEEQVLPTPEENPSGQGAVCNQLDDDCDGLIDNQSGTTAPLWRRCSSQPESCRIQVCEGSAWSECRLLELCGNLMDDNCDGAIDEAGCVSAK
ncbi:MAG TPA: hypothetical protein DCE42_19665 [Myxococcales bacterium]|nr:hypothetical protein [Deltaproteobacteria bacterium]MBU52128.1 hypothetical protein [Deltaproteobacteria bacterium]HAA56994.1 hypothetical protein [Myxococcales bacterium]